MPGKTTAERYPLVTYFSPCYNHEKYIIQSLESIKNQTYPNIQHIIIDDASTDNSAAIIQTWIDQNKYNCEFIRHKENKGISITLNEGIKLSKGVFFAPLATDDYTDITRTERFIDYFAQNADAGMVVSDMLMVDENSKPVKVNNTFSFILHSVVNHPAFSFEHFGTYESLLFGNYIAGSLMIKKTVFDTVGLFNEQLKIEDWDMWLRVSAKYKIGYINEFLSYYRKHSQNTMKQVTSIQKDPFITLMKQKEYCLQNNKSKLFRQAYNHHFNGMFSFTSKNMNAYIFEQSNLSFFFVAFCYKLKKVLQRAFTSK